MTSPNSGSEVRARKVRIERRRQRRKIIDPVRNVFAVIVLLVLGVGLAYNFLVVEPRVEADVTAEVESRGGEVVRFAHDPRVEPGSIPTPRSTFASWAMISALGATIEPADTQRDFISSVSAVSLRRALLLLGPVLETGLWGTGLYRQKDYATARVVGRLCGQIGHPS